MLTRGVISIGNSSSCARCEGALCSTANLDDTASDVSLPDDVEDGVMCHLCGDQLWPVLYCKCPHTPPTSRASPVEHTLSQACFDSLSSPLSALIADDAFQRCINIYSGAFMLGNVSGRKRRAASPAEADAVDALANMSEASFRALQAALDSTRSEESGPEHEHIITVLARHLGTMRVEIGTIRALNAVLNRHIRPDRYRRNQDAIKAFRASAKQYYVYAKQVKDLMDLRQVSSTAVSSSGSSSTTLGNSSAAGGSDLNHGVCSSSDSTAAAGTGMTIRLIGSDSPGHEFITSSQRRPDTSMNCSPEAFNEDRLTLADFSDLMPGSAHLDGSWEIDAHLEPELEALRNTLVNESWIDSLLAHD